MSDRTRLTAASILLFTIALAAGCSSPSGGEKMVQGYSRTRATLVQSQSKVDNTLMMMNSVRRAGSGSLNNSFQQYKSAVDELEQQGKDAKKLAADLKKDSEKNIEAWQKEMETIDDPTIKASMESRRSAVRSNYAQIRSLADDARKAYDPFMKTNQDIIKALSIDLSPAAISGMSTVMDRATTEGQTLKTKLAAMQKALDNIANGQPPAGQ